MVRGQGFEPGKTYALNWTHVVGNRMTGAYWIKATALPVTDGAQSAPRSACTSRAWAGQGRQASIIWSTAATTSAACAFNSQGDVELIMKATGVRLAFIVYPGI